MTEVFVSHKLVLLIGITYFLSYHPEYDEARDRKTREYLVHVYNAHKEFFSLNIWKSKKLCLFLIGLRYPNSLRPQKKECSGFDTKQYRILGPQFGGSEERRVPYYCY